MDPTLLSVQAQTQLLTGAVTFTTFLVSPHTQDLFLLPGYSGSSQKITPPLPISRAFVLLPSGEFLTLSPLLCLFRSGCLLWHYTNSLTLSTHSHDSRDSTKAATGRTLHWLSLGPAFPQVGIWIRPSNPVASLMLTSHCSLRTSRTQGRGRHLAVILSALWLAPISVPCDCVNTLYFPSFLPGRHGV